ncbi:MAG: hypothetical protein DHS20C14_16090 [Phycisphaeraceae bacterium]|nr:MAG: hypothetical protein DHS20C14_16090 [Phycisphaeraceae bacterium]
MSTRTRHALARPLAPCVAAAVVLLAGACNVQPTASGPDLAQQRYTEALALIEDAQSLADRGKTEQAIEKYQLAIGANPRIATAWHNLGVLLMGGGSYADAVSAFERASELDPADPRPLYNAGVVYQSQGWARDALSRFELALDRDPTYLPALRGAVQAAESLQISDAQTIDRIKRATLAESDETWRAYFQRQRFRVEAGLSASREH